MNMLDLTYGDIYINDLKLFKYMNFDEYSNMLRMFKHYFIYKSSVDNLSKYQVVALMILFTLCKKLLSLILC